MGLLEDYITAVHRYGKDSPEAQAALAAYLRHGEAVTIATQEAIKQYGSSRYYGELYTQIYKRYSAEQWTKYEQQVKAAAQPESPWITALRIVSPISNVFLNPKETLDAFITSLKFASPILNPEVQRLIETNVMTASPLYTAAKLLTGNLGEIGFPKITFPSFDLGLGGLSGYLWVFVAGIVFLVVIIILLRV
jgi:hypothetical protein